MFVVTILCFTIIVVALIIAAFSNDGDSAKAVIGSIYDGKKKVVEARAAGEISKLKQEAINRQITNDFLNTKLQ